MILTKEEIQKRFEQLSNLHDEIILDYEKHIQGKGFLGGDQDVLLTEVELDAIENDEVNLGAAYERYAAGKKKFINLTKELLPELHNLLRIFAEFATMKDGNAFFKTLDEPGQDDTWYQQYYLEVFSTLRGNSHATINGVTKPTLGDGWAGASKCVSDVMLLMTRPELEETKENLQTLLILLK